MAGGSDVVGFVTRIFFFFEQKEGFEVERGLVGSEMCIRDRFGIFVKLVGDILSSVGGGVFFEIFCYQND